MSWQEISSKLSSLQSEMWTKASASDLDRAKSRIRELEQDVQHEKNARYGAEENHRRLAERVDALDAAADEARRAAEDKEGRERDAENHKMPGVV